MPSFKIPKKKTLQTPFSQGQVSVLFFSAWCVASHAGVFRGARISSLPTPQEIRAPLKTPAWEVSITGALQAKRGKRSICEKRESQDERRRKTKAPVAGPLFWLFHARLHLKRLLTDGGHVKRTNEKLKTRSINRQQHKLQEVKTTRT